MASPNDSTFSGAAGASQHADAGFTSNAAGGKAKLTVTISDPVKQGEGISAYVSYKVAAQVSADTQ